MAVAMVTGAAKTAVAKAAGEHGLYMGVALKPEVGGQLVCPSADPSQWLLHRYSLSGLNASKGRASARAINVVGKL